MAIQFEVGTDSWLDSSRAETGEFAQLAEPLIDSRKPAELAVRAAATTAVAVATAEIVAGIVDTVVDIVDVALVAAVLDSRAVQE